MKPRSTLILVVLAALLFGFIWFFERHQRSLSAPEIAGHALPHLRPAAVTRLQVRPAGRPEIVAERTNQTWLLTRPAAYPAAEDAINGLLLSLDQITTRGRLSGEEVRQRRDADKEFGFDPPAYSVVINQGDEVTQVLIGHLVKPLQDQVFVQVVGLEGVFFADASLLNFLPGSADAWRSLVFVDLKNVPFDRIAVTNGAKSFELESVPGPTRWRLARPMEARADSVKVEALLAQLQGAAVAGFIPGGAAEAESRGLQPAELSLALLRGTNLLRSLQFGRSPTNDPGLVFARNSRWDSIVLLPGEAVAGWRGGVTDFRDRRLTSVAPGQVDEVEFRGQSPFALRRVTNDVWRVTGTNGFLADPAFVYDVLGMLGTLEVAEFVKDVVTPLDLPNYGLAPARLAVILRVADTNVPGAPPGGVLAHLEFGTNRADSVFARRADESAVYAVRAAAVQRLPSFAWQLRDRRLWSFDENDVARLLVEQGTNQFEVIRNGANQWTVSTNAPAGLNDLALDTLAQKLGQVRVVGWASRSEADLPRAGITASTPRLTVVLKDGARRSLRFGGRSPHGFLLAAAEVDGQVAIFEFPATLWQELAEFLRVPAPGGTAP